MQIHHWTSVILLFIAACSPLKPQPKLMNEQLPFLQDNQTMQRDVLERLGSPTYQYQHGQIYIYGMLRDAKGQLQVVAPPPRANGTVTRSETYHLVLVFHSDGRLERHVLLQVQ